MRADVDLAKCRTTGGCVKVCPDVFRFLEGSKKATVTRNPIPPELEDRVCEAAWLCPAKAITIEM